MNTITQTLKNTAVNGVIPIDRALQVAAPLDMERENTITLLKECERNVGMYLGEKINEHIAGMTGGFFNALEYNYEKPVGEQ
jgi:hypothetical protein